MVQGLGLCALTAEGPGSIPGRGTMIPQAVQPKKKERKMWRSEYTGMAYLNVKKKNNCHIRTIYPEKLPFKNEREIKTFPDKQQ